MVPYKASLCDSLAARPRYTASLVVRRPHNSSKKKNLLLRGRCHSYPIDDGEDFALNECGTEYNSP